MSLSPGFKLGPYSVLSPLGAGGMGEVYRARDPRLARDVAIKVLPASLIQDPDRLKRFEHEARSAGSLNHPGLLTVFDVGTDDGCPYIVSELLEGSTLRTLLLGDGLPPRKALDYAIQIARGLAAAHEKDIIHRDLKPENIFITRDDRAKILDFGLAKLSRASEGFKLESAAETVSSPTSPGTVLGTVGYMSPEQVQGLGATQASDIFSFGAVLYEMLSGQRAFKGQTAVEAMNAILKEDPPEFQDPAGRIPPVLDRIVRRCLEKRPEARFHSAHDLGLALDAVSGATAAVPTTVRPSRRLVGAIAAAVLLGASMLAFLLGRTTAERPAPSYRQLTFRRGIADKARFAPDGQTLVYSARWDGKPSEVLTARLDLAGAQALSLARGASLEAQHGGEALVHYDDGRLARIPLVGGPPRDVAENVDEADWGPTDEMAVIRKQAGPKERIWLEYPAGKTVLESSSLHPLHDLRISPQGDRVALVMGAYVGGGLGGDVVVVDRQGGLSVLSSGWADVEGIGWSPDGREVWFTAGGRGESTEGILKELRAVSLQGHERLLLRMAGDLTLRDVSRDGRVLVSHGRTRFEARGKLSGDERDRDLTYLDGTFVVGISADGTAVLFDEEGQAAGPHSTTYLRRVGDPGPIRLGEGSAMALSPDGRRAFVAFDLFESGRGRYTILSAGPEPPLELSHGTLDRIGWGEWMPDGRRVVFIGWEKDRPVRSWILELPNGQPRPVSPEGTRCYGAMSLRWLPCFHKEEDHGRIVPMWELRSPDSGETRPAPWMGTGDHVMAWSPDGRYAFLEHDAPTCFRVLRVDVATGRREPWLESAPPDPSGIKEFTAETALTPDGRYYAYGYTRTLSDLFLVEGVR